MKEVQEGRHSLTYLLAHAFFSAVKNVIFDFVRMHTWFIWTIIFHYYSTLYHQEITVKVPHETAVNPWCCLDSFISNLLPSEC